MTFRDSTHYQEAQRRLTRKARCRTDLGRYWHHRQFIAALKALLEEKQPRGARGNACE